MQRLSSSVPMHMRTRPDWAVHAPSWHPMGRQDTSRRQPATLHGDRRRSRRRIRQPTPAPTQDYANQNIAETAFDYENEDEVVFDTSRNDGAEHWDSEHEAEGPQLARQSQSSEELSVKKLQTSQPAPAQRRHPQPNERWTGELNVQPVHYQSAPVPIATLKAESIATTKATPTTMEHPPPRPEAPSSRRVIAKQSLDRIQHHIQQLQHIYKSRSGNRGADQQNL